MKCEEVRRFADLYIDGEFDERESALFQDHLASCEQCRVEVNALMAFQEALRRKIGPARMPSEVKERIVAAAFQQARSESSRQWVTWPARVAVTLAVLLVATVGLYNVLPSQQDDVVRFVEESVAEHEAGLPLDMAGDEKGVEGYVARTADSGKLSLPLKEDDSTKLLGVRVTRIGKTRAILYRYLHKGREISVVRWPRINAEPAPEGSSEFARVVYEGDRDGHPVRLLESPGYSTTVVGDIPKRDLIRLIPASL